MIPSITGCLSNAVDLRPCTIREEFASVSVSCLVWGHAGLEKLPLRRYVTFYDCGAYNGQGAGHGYVFGYGSFGNGFGFCRINQGTLLDQDRYEY